MRLTLLDREQTKLITLRALRTYVEGLGWKNVVGVTGVMSAYHSPQDPTRQLLVPLDGRLDDYADRVVETVERLADFERLENVGRTHQNPLYFMGILAPESHNCTVFDGGNCVHPAKRLIFREL